MWSRYKIVSRLYLNAFAKLFDKIWYNLIITDTTDIFTKHKNQVHNWWSNFTNDFTYIYHECLQVLWWTKNLSSLSRNNWKLLFWLLLLILKLSHFVYYINWLSWTKHPRYRTVLELRFDNWAIQEFIFSNVWRYP